MTAAVADDLPARADRDRGATRTAEGAQVDGAAFLRPGEGVLGAASQPLVPTTCPLGLTATAELVEPPRVPRSIMPPACVQEKA